MHGKDSKCYHHCLEDCATVRVRGSRSLTYPIASVDVVFDLVTLIRKSQLFGSLVDKLHFLSIKTVSLWIKIMNTETIKKKQPQEFLNERKNKKVKVSIRKYVTCNHNGHLTFEYLTLCLFSTNLFVDNFSSFVHLRFCIPFNRFTPFHKRIMEKSL